MSSYPPPPPPPYDPVLLKQQIRMGKEQARFNKQQARIQRAQVRAQIRRYRRRSIVGPLVLLGLGVVFLLAQTGRICWAQALEWYAHWWPVVLIAAGIVLTAEWAIDQRPQPDGSSRSGRVLGGGVIVLLILLAVAGVGSRATDRAIAWENRTFGNGFPGFDVALGQRHDADDTVSSAIAEGNSLLIRNPHGDVTVTGSSDDGQVHVSVHKEAFARTDSDADTKEDRLQPTFSKDGSNLVLEVAAVEGGQDDLMVQVPKNTALTVRADHGAIDIQEIHAAVSLSANSGEVNLSGITGPVSAHVNDENSSFSAHSITGGLTMDGRAGDINVSDVTGPLSLQGDFFGTTHLERVNGQVKFKTSRTQFEAARIDGDFDVALDSDLEANQVLGPVLVSTRDRDINLDRVQGNVQIANRNGAVALTSATPLGQIDIANQHGSVDVGVPAGAGFTLNAQTRNGDIENDFDLKTMETAHDNVLTGTVAGGGPAIKIDTSDGDVTVRKATVLPLPPIAPMPKITITPPTPRIVITPPSPVVTVAPTAPKSPRVPKSLKAPLPPKPATAPKTPADPEA